MACSSSRRRRRPRSSSACRRCMSGLSEPRVGQLASLRLCVSGRPAALPMCWRGVAELRSSGHRALRHDRDVMNMSNPHDGDRRPGSVGSAARCRGPPRRNDEICGRGPERLRRVLGAPDADGRRIPRTDGSDRRHRRVRRRWLPSIVGRSKDLIITGGFNVYPRRSRSCSPSIRRRRSRGRRRALRRVGEDRGRLCRDPDAVTEAELIEWWRSGSPRQAAAPRAVPRCPARNALGRW